MLFEKLFLDDICCLYYLCFWGEMASMVLWEINGTILTGVDCLDVDEDEDAIYYEWVFLLSLGPGDDLLVDKHWFLKCATT